MPKAKNATPAATVRRFNGGQFSHDGQDGQVKGNAMGRANYHVTNLGGFKNPRGGSQKFAANVGVHPRAPQSGDRMQIDSDEGVNVRNFDSERIRQYKGPVGTSWGAKRSPSKIPANVGGGHSRKHQG